MGAELRRRHHLRRFPFASGVTALAAFLLLASVSAISLNPARQPGGGERLKEEASWRRRSGGGGSGSGSGSGSEENMGRYATQKRIGSSPPTCRSKCGRCWPCRPVQVPIQPGFTMLMEYYPEAWRCKCNNKLFMP